MVIPHVHEAIETLDRRVVRLAGFIIDTIVSSGGVVSPPSGYLSTIAGIVRDAGGLFIADEVQPGFGRTGRHFWGYQADHFVPDIVTMGKPMGNGHPLAGIVARRDVTEAFAAGGRYFNTFGGNPVSCAAGLAVLEVIEKEALQHNALEVGQYLKERLAILQRDYPVIGEFHGSGLILGIDIIKPNGAPNSEMADQIMNHMRENGVLIGTTGKNYATLKVRPPIVFQKEHAEILLVAMTKALDDILSLRSA